MTFQNFLLALGVGTAVLALWFVVRFPDKTPESFAKAADAAVREAAKTLRGISGADVVTMSAVVENDRISQYRTTVNIAFGVERGGSGA